MYPPSIIASYSAALTSATGHSACTREAALVVGATPAACIPSNWTAFTTETELNVITGTGKSHVFGNSSLYFWMDETGSVACDSFVSDFSFAVDTVTTISGYDIQTPAVGDIGDAMGVYIHNSSNKAYKPYALRAA
jgi:hypothetical protein